MGWLRRVLIEGDDPGEQIANEATEFLKTGKVPAGEATQAGQEETQGGEVTRYYIKVSGCDDRTEVIVELNHGEAAAVERVAKAVTEASFVGCMPRMHFRVATEDDTATVAERLAERDEAMKDD